MELSPLHLRDAARPQLLWGLCSIAFLEGEPLALLNKRALEGREARQIAKLPQEFREFCEHFTVSRLSWRRRFRRLETELFHVFWQNASPLARVLREHELWRWFEIALLVRGAVGADRPQRPTVELFDPFVLQYAFKDIDHRHVMVVGPVQTWTGSSGRRAESGFVDFVRILEKYPARQRAGSKAHVLSLLYTAEQLHHYAQARPLRSSSCKPAHIEQLARLVGDTLKYLSRVVDRASLTQTGEICALLSTRAFMRALTPNSDAANSLAKIIHAKLTAINSERESPDPGFSGAAPELITSIRHKQDFGLLSWNQYFQESLSILDDRLSGDSHMSIAPMSFQKEEEAQNRWGWVCTFISKIFLSDEVTIYRYHVAEKGAYLSPVAAHCSDRNSSDKIASKTEFMKAAGFDPAMRGASAAYRAADTNSVEYIQDAAVQEGRQQVLQPDRRLWPDVRGSVLEIPVRVNGCVWGVLELIASHPCHYGPLMRYKCEEVAFVLSSAFLYSNVFETISRMDSYWSDDFASNRGRRTELCYELSSIFLCDALSVYSGSRNADGKHFNVQEFGAWSNGFGLGSGAQSGSSGMDLLDVRDFLDSGERVREVTWSVGFAPQPEYRQRRTFLVLISPQSMTGWAGALAFSLPYPVGIDAKWEQTTYALGQLVGGIISNLTSNVSWAREARQVLRHEYKRITSSLRGIKQRLDTRILTRLAGEDRRVGLLVAADLDEAAMSLDRMSDALLVDVYERLLNDDPRLVPVVRALESFDARSASPVNIRDLFYRKFLNASNAEPAKRLKITYSEGDNLPGVLIDALVISDVLGTLADNAVKYSIPGSNIIMSALITKGGALAVTISNLGPALQGEEDRRIFKDGFRGSFARREFPTRGSGRGLGFAKKAMELWNCALRYRAAPPSIEVEGALGYDLMWHRFILTFPPSALAS